jgi:CubicO group peptidase (beta-lactamase class C family)
VRVSHNAVTALSLSLTLCAVTFAAEGLYFPASGESWESVDPAAVGWDADLLDAALDIAGDRDSSGVVMLHNGRIMAERYWEVPNPPRRYRNMVTGTDDQGHPIEDVASAQKSVAAVLTGMAQERGFLQLDDPVTKHLGAGWSKATPTQERAITLRHLLSMNSGLAVDFTFETEPDTKWLYNTPVYHLVMQVLTAATGMERNALTDAWIAGSLGMEHSSWTPRPWASADIAVGFSTTARELARFGLMIQAGGRWQDEVLLRDGSYLKEMLSSSQSLNPSYGYLWWLNGAEFSLAAGARALRRDGQMIAAAPADLVAMQGALDRKLYLVPSLGLVVTRLGAAGGAGGDRFNDAFWEAVMRAAPADQVASTPRVPAL